MASSSLNIAQDEDREAVIEGFDKLSQSNAGQPGWEVVLDGKGLRRGFRFRGFNRAWVCLSVLLSRCAAFCYLSFEKLIFAFLSLANVIDLEYGTYLCSSVRAEFEGYSGVIYGHFTD